MLQKPLFQYWNGLLVKVGNFDLTFYVKIVYNTPVFRQFLLFLLRMGLIAVLWAFIWRVIEPRTQLMRILRAALLVLGLLGVLAVLKLSGP
jgi:hypothetical protein